MKILFSLIFISFFTININAQILKKVKKAAERGVERTVIRKVENKSSEETEEVLDKVFEKEQKEKNDNGNNEKTNQKNSQSKPPTNNNSTIVNDKSNIPEINGKLIFKDNFNTTPIGDFPLGFTSSSGGSIVELKQARGLLFNPNSNILIQTKELPNNFALAFNLTLENVPPSLYNTFFNVYIQQNLTLKHNDPKNKYGAIGFSLWGDSKDHQIDLFNYKTTFEIKEKIPFDVNNQLINNTASFLLIVQKYRLQLFINGNKIADSPNLLEGMKGNYINFRLNGTKKENKQYFVISDVKITEIEEDLRTKMLEGAFSTSEILFSTNSAKIENSSYTILNEIGKVMQDHLDVKFLIVGHTDSDGNAEANLILSQKRAEAVKQYLLDNFKINSNNLQTLGKGESEPVANNDTVFGKSQNRRVEFLKEN